MNVTNVDAKVVQRNVHTGRHTTPLNTAFKNHISKVTILNPANGFKIKKRKEKSYITDEIYR